MTLSALDPLPVDEALPRLLAALAEQGGAVLEAPPGAGKSTRVPLMLLEAPWRQGRRILVLEPRRVAARAVASFMARQLGQPLGGVVGYRMRDDSRVSADTVIEVVTEGVLTRLLLDDPSLAGYAAVLFDEFHERSLQADLGLALVHEVRGALRADLRLLVMSATLDGAALGEALTLPVVRSRGRSFPVTVRHEAPTQRQHWLDHCAHVIRMLVEGDTHEVAKGDTQGTTLVFLPGLREIRQLQERLNGLPAAVQVLHGRLDSAAQARVLRAPEQGGRVVLATNVAETSVTIEGVTRVVDSGLERRPRYDPRRHRERLVTRRISQANADQRAGRAGRLGPGECVRLWPREEVLARHIEPEIRQTGLQGLVLDLACWGCRDPAQLFWLDPPPTAAWNAAVADLKAREILDTHERVTALGREVGRLPLKPESAALVLKGRRSGLPETAARLALLLEERVAAFDGECDLTERLRLFSSGGREFIALQRRLKRLLHGAGQDRQGGDPGLLLAEVFPGRVACRRDDEDVRYLLADGSGARLPERHRLNRHLWLVVLDTDGQPEDALIRLAWPLSEAAVATLLDRQATSRETVYWNDQAGRVEARRIQAVGAIEVDSEPLADVAPERVQQGLLTGIGVRGLTVLPWDEPTRQWRARANLMHSLESQNWPDFADQALLATLDQWLAPFLPGRRQLRDLATLPLSQALRLRMGEQRARQLDQLLPATVSVASGRRVSLNYCGETPPRLAVKLQECFGMAALPTLAGGRVTITVELLTPAGRPAAITSNLARFWREGYPLVRKDLRGRYPKHPWPEDPLTATATAGTRHRQGAPASRSRDSG